MKHETFKIEKVEMINKTLRFPLPLLKTLQQVAKDKGVSLNKLIIQCCEYALRNLEE